MAVEQRRRCGFRKVGGIYLVTDGGWVGCDRIPIPLEVCPTCHAGVKQSRGWTWIDAPAILGGPHDTGKIGDVVCTCDPSCPVCNPQILAGEHTTGLLWIGEKFYPRPSDFMAEATSMGM